MRDSDFPTVPSNEIVKVISTALAKIRNLQYIRKNIISVKSQERISVKDERRNTCNEYNIISDYMQCPCRCISPDDRCNRGNKKLNHNSRHANDCSVPFSAKSPRTGCIHVWQRNKHQKHHSHNMYLPP